MSYYKYDGSLATETPAAANSQWGSSAGHETLIGGAGADALAAGGPNDLLIGNGGGDTFYIQGSGTQIQEVAGTGAPDQIVAWQNIDLAHYSNIENLNVGGSNDYAAGDRQDNILYATGSHQELYGGGGQDVLIGNGQSDTFVVVKGEGDDAIYGFNPANDVVRLSAGFTSFAQVQQHMTQVGADVNIDLGDGAGVVLRGTAVSQLSAANFQLQLDSSQIGKMTFGDEFNTLSLWNGASGAWSTTFWYQDTNGAGGSIGSNGEQEWYINSNYAATASVQPWTVNNGVLTITAAPAAASIQPLINGYQYTSGEINTVHSFAQTYGYFEMRAELPQNAGGWPAFWLVPADGSWPPELDVMETLTNDPHADYTTSHSSIGGNTQSQGVSFIPDTSSGYHTYGVLWTKTTLTWYVDGTEVYETATPADMNKPMYMIANLALGGWGGDVDASQLPAQLKIDYIHAYALADGSSTVSLDTAPADSSGAGPDTGLAASDAAGAGGTTTGGGAPVGSTGGGGSGGGWVAASPVGQALNAAAGGGSLNGGEGPDTLTGDAHGFNVLHGGAGDDSIAGGLGFNQVNGNAGDDTIVGHSAAGDWLLGGQGQDAIDASGSSGNNILNGNLGGDTLTGGSGSDTLRGGQGDDVLHAGSGNDWISGDLGNNTIAGGQGMDTFHAGAGHDVVAGWHAGDHIQVAAGVTYGVAQVNADVHVTFSNGGEMDLLNVQQSSLQNGWIVSS
jgi:beta-glucanase (GH16 family)